VARATIKQAGRVRTLLEEVPGSRRLPEELSHFAGLLEQVISQACRRVFRESVFRPKKNWFPSSSNTRV
jgi:hypothetical protein